MHWITAVAELRRHRQPGVLVTVAAVRGHAPREAGAKMVVGEARCWGTIGGGNLEESAVRRARELLSEPGPAREPETATVSLTERAPARYGVQCCGGEVTLLYEPLRPVPAVAIFGMGHVGTELARILARHDLELHLVDSRAAQVDRLGSVTADALARVHRHHAPVPELVLGELPAGSHVLIMTHDHAEDAALCDAALRCGHLGSIGLIGSSAKWRRFEKKLAAEGHGPEALARITTPIGLPEITGKDPATIAVGVAADLLVRFERAQADRAEPGAADPERARQGRPEQVAS
jgi:xanthine dehydrogenase accessory factor